MTSNNSLFIAVYININASINILAAPIIIIIIIIIVHKMY
jgi:hypothetical protein